MYVLGAASCVHVPASMYVSVCVCVCVCVCAHVPAYKKERDTCKGFSTSSKAHLHPCPSRLCKHITPLFLVELGFYHLCPKDSVNMDVM